VARVQRHEVVEAAKRKVAAAGGRVTAESHLTRGVLQNRDTDVALLFILSGATPTAPDYLRRRLADASEAGLPCLSAMSIASASASASERNGSSSGRPN